MSPTSHWSCCFCGCELEHTFVDLGASPLAQSFLRRDQLNEMEPSVFPSHVGSQEYMQQCYGLTDEAIAKTVVGTLRTSLRNFVRIDNQ